MRQCIDCKRHKEDSDFKAYTLAHASGLTRSCMSCLKIKIAHTKQVRKNMCLDQKKEQELMKALAKYTQTVADIHVRFDIRWTVHASFVQPIVRRLPKGHIYIYVYMHSQGMYYSIKTFEHPSGSASGGVRQHLPLPSWPSGQLPGTDPMPHWPWTDLTCCNIDCAPVQGCIRPTRLRISKPQGMAARGVRGVTPLNRPRSTFIRTPTHITAHTPLNYGSN